MQELLEATPMLTFLEATRSPQVMHDYFLCNICLFSEMEQRHFSTTGERKKVAFYVRFLHCERVLWPKIATEYIKICKAKKRRFLFVW
jgi:hypothetical protein